MGMHKPPSGSPSSGGDTRPQPAPLGSTCHRQTPWPPTPALTMHRPTLRAPHTPALTLHRLTPWAPTLLNSPCSCSMRVQAIREPLASNTT